MFKRIVIAIILTFFVSTSGFFGLKFFFSSNKAISFVKPQNPVQSVLAAATQAPHFIFKVNVPSFFNDNVQFAKDVDIQGGLTVKGKTVFNSAITINNQNLDLGTGNLIASNILYGIKAGNGVTITAGQTPTIAVNNTGGVTSLQSQTGDLTLTAGSGISIDGLKISATTNTTQNTFKTISDGTNSFSAGSDSDTLILTAGSGMTITTDTTNKKLTFSSSSTSPFSGLTTNGVLYATSGTTVNSLTPGNSGFILQSNGTGIAPSWINASSVGTNYWQLNSGTLSPATLTNTIAIGATSGLAHSGVDIEQNGLGNAIFVANQAGSGDIFTASSAGTTRFTIANDGTLIAGADGGTPGNVTIRGGQASGSNVTGGNLYLDASNGTGANGSGDLIFRTAPGANNTIQLDHASHSNNTGNTLTWTHATGNQTSMVLIVGVNVQDSTKSVASVTYKYNGGANQQSLTKVDSATVNGVFSGQDVEMWYLPNPTRGSSPSSNTITVTLAGGASAFTIAGAATYYNVNTTTPLDLTNKIKTSGTAGGGSNTISVTVPNTTSTEVIADVFGNNNSGFMPAQGSGQTLEYTDSSSVWGSDKPGITGSTPMSWTNLNSSDYVEIAVPILPVQNSNPDTLADRMHITGSGSVGIGTSTPLGSTGLDIEKNSLGNAAMIVNNTGGSGDILTASSAGIAKFVIDKSGNVSIGNGTPSAALDVVNNNTVSGPAGFQNKVPIIINNNSNSNTLTNYQVNFTLDTATLIADGKMQSNCADIRVTDSDGSTNLNYWLEGTCNTSSTKIWTKVPSITASTSKTIYVYYNNPSATSQSSVSNVFVRDINNLVSHWSLEESSGSTINDTSGNGNNGTATGTTVVSGKFTNARQFSSNSDFISFDTGHQTNVPYTSSARTVCAWGKLNNPIGSGVYGFMFGYGADSTNNAFALGGNNTSAELGAWNNDLKSANFWSGTGTWHYLCGTYNGTTETIYGDGSLLNSAASSLNTTSGNAMYIGLGQQQFDGRWPGAIEQVTMYSRALTSAEISDLYSNYGYATTSYSGHELVRKFSSPDPSTTTGSEKNASSNSHTLFVDANNTGNIGIGTSTPSSFALQINGSVGPDVTDTYNLGSSSLEWNTLYVKNLVTSATNGQNGFWQLNSGVLAPATIANSLAIGQTTALASSALDIEKNSLGNAALVVNNSGGAGDILTASSSGSTKFVIDKSGNVGIGTSTPTSELYVNGNANDMVIINSSFDTGFIRPFEILDSSITTGHNLIYHVGHDLGTNDTAYFGFNYQGANSANNLITMGMFGADNLVNINANGNMGIGTMTPKNKLDVVGSAAIGSYAGSNTAPSNSLIVSGSGGIGNNNPSNLLDVNGNANDMVVVTSTLSTGFIRPIEMLDSNMTAGQNLVYHVGHDTTTNNTAYIGFHYIGSGNPENWLTMGFWGNDNIYNFTPNGHVGFGTTAMGNGALVVNQQNLSGNGNIFSASQSGTTVFNIDNSGNTRIVASLCVKATFSTACAGNSAGTIYATNTTVQSADVAENYISNQNLEPGDLIVPAMDGNNQAVIKTTSEYQSQTIGIVSTKPGVTLNSDAQTDSKHPNLYPIALQGRVPVKVSSINGIIHKGDLLTSSSIPGVAMKATKPGQIIGKALEDYTDSSLLNIGKIMVFVNISWNDPTMQIAITNTGDLSLNGKTITTDPTKINNTQNSSDQLAKIQDQITTLSTQMEKITDLSDHVTKLQKEIEQSIQSSSSAGFKLSTENNVFGGSLTVSGKTTLTDLGITGRITDGLLAVNGLDESTGTASATINTLSAPLKIQSLALNGVDFENGRVTIDPNGNININANLTAKSISTEKINIATDKTATNSGILNTSAGSITIEAGSDNIDVQTTALTNKSLIFLTPDIPVAVGYKLKNSNTFNIYLQEALKQNLKINWWIIN